MKKITTLLFALVMGFGFTIGLVFSPTLSYANVDERKICKHSTGDCVTATIPYECPSCTIIEIN